MKWGKIRHVQGLLLPDEFRLELERYKRGEIGLKELNRVWRDCRDEVRANYAEPDRHVPTKIVAETHDDPSLLGIHKPAKGQKGGGARRRMT